MNKKSIISSSFSLMLAASMLAACGPTVNQGTAPDTSAPAVSNNSGTANAGVNAGATVDASTSTPVVASSESTAEMQAALQTVVADEAAFNDADTLTADGSFQTQALGVEQEGEVSATALIGARLPLRETRVEARTEARAEARASAAPAVRAAVAARRAIMGAAVRAETKARMAAQAEAKKAMFLEKKADLEASGALTVNADGTLTIDPEKLRAEVKANNAERKAKAKAKVEQVKARLQTMRELAQDKKAKLVSKAQAVRTSETEEIENEDGSITQITKIEFNNEKAGVTRNVTVTKTMMDGKLVSSFFTLEATHKNYTRTVERSVEVNAEGERTVKAEAMTTWSNGRKRERSEERVVAADGSASGGGTMTITRADGTVKTYTYTLGISAEGDLVIEGDEAEDSEETGAEVTVEGSTTDTDVVVVVEEGGETTEVEVNLEENDAEDVATEEEVAEAESADTEEASEESTEAEASAETEVTAEA